MGWIDTWVQNRWQMTYTQEQLLCWPSLADDMIGALCEYFTVVHPYAYIVATGSMFDIDVCPSYHVTRMVELIDMSQDILSCSLQV